MSHQRYPSIDPKEPHSVSLKVLRLSRPSLAAQYPLSPPLSTEESSVADQAATSPIPASLAYSSNSSTNPDPFLLTPVLNLPPSFGSAYVGETFSCTLCANHDVPPFELPALSPTSPGPSPAVGPQHHTKKKLTRDVRIEAEMKTPSATSAQKLSLLPADTGGEDDEHREYKGVDLDAGQTLQKIVNFNLKEEGNHVLAVTVSYYEATETSGRARTFRKLYQFICKGSLIVRTKVGALSPSSTVSPASTPTPDAEQLQKRAGGGRRRWVMEAQLENCSEDVMQLERVGLNLEAGLRYRDCNYWGMGNTNSSPGSSVANPVLHPGEVEQCCFVVEETGPESAEEKSGRVVFGVLGIGWRSEMGNRGFLSTGKLGTRVAR